MIDGVRLVVFGSLIVCAFAVASAPAVAQSAAEPAESSAHPAVLVEVLVTARKRQESIQDTPLAVSALSAELLDAAHAANLSDLSNLAPNLWINNGPGGVAAPVMFLRGFGVKTDFPSIDPGISVAIDGVYLSQTAGALLDVFDVQQIEVLRGPQGALVGKNAAGGAINITTSRPSGEFDGRVQLDYARFDTVEARGLLNFPIVSDKLAGKVSVFSRNGGGYIRNTAFPVAELGADDITTVRGGLLFTPNDALEWYLSADYYRNRSDQKGLRNVSSAVAFPRQPVPVACRVFQVCNPNPEPHTNSANFRDGLEADATSVTSNLAWDLQPVSITSVTGYREYEESNNLDVDASPASILHAPDNVLDSRQFSQELRLSSRTDGGWDLRGRLDWVAGLYYLDYSFDNIKPLSVFGGPPAASFQDQTLKSKAVFAHVQYRITEPWSISFGGRRTWDDKDSSFISAGFPPSSRVFQRGEWANTSLEAGTQYRLAEDKMLYLRYAEGYRGGGFSGVPGNPANAASYEPETGKSYELGAKTDWLDRRLRLNLAIFHNQYDDLQRDVIVPSSGAAGFVATVSNAATATIQGVELEAAAIPVDALTLRANLGYLDAKYDRFFADLTGTGVPTDNSDLRLVYSPKWTANVGADYAVELPGAGLGPLTFTANYEYLSRFTTEALDIPLGARDAYGLLSASIRLDSESRRLAMTLYGKNLTDEEYILWSSPTGNLSHSVYDGMPRMWGVSLSASF